MKHTTTIIGVFCAVAGLFLLPYLPQAYLTYYEPALFALVAAVLFLGLINLRKKQASFSGTLMLRQVLIILTVSLGVFYIGGPGYRWNPVLFAAAGFAVGMSSRFSQAAAGLVYLWAVHFIWYFNSIYHFLPQAEKHGDFFPLSWMVYPLLCATITGLIAAFYHHALLPAGPSGGVPGRSGGSGDGEDAECDGESETGLEQTADIESTESTLYVTQEYLQNQETQKRESMKSILETVVYFMSKNFKSRSAIGFLASEDGHTLHLNAAVTKSQKLNRQAVITLRQGIVGRAALKSTGFASGEIKSYPDKLEYYSEAEEINSIMVMPVKDPETGKLDGLLVVDSDHLRAFSDEHKELMRRFTQIASAMISNARLTHQVHQQAKWADTLYEITRTLTKVLKIQEVISILGESVSKIFVQDRVVITTYNTKSGKGQIWNVWGNSEGLSRGMEFDIRHPQSLYGFVFSKRKDVFMTDLRKRKELVRFDFEEDLDKKPEEMLIVPIFDEKQSIIAVVGLESNQKGSYADREMKMMRTLITNFSTAITKARIYGELEKLATIDGLTQIANHRKFQETLAAELYRTERYHDKLSLLLMDIDHFKKFNDTYGHPAGDAVLKAVSKVLQRVVRGTDLCARYGGEEFVVIVVKATEEQSFKLAERIRTGIEEMEVNYEGTILKVAMSIGSATFPEDATNKTDLIDCADKALYYSKEHGRNRVTLFSKTRNPE